MPTPPVFGHVGSAQAGDLFHSRLELSLLRQHRPRRAGVCATAARGAESIILADQYEDDEIQDDYFWYAGHGGRDAKTGRQVADQQLDARNRGLLRSQATGWPVRMYRRIEVAPAPWQFRYEGLWRVVAHEYGPGKSGFLVYRFRLEPWSVPPTPFLMTDDQIQAYAEAHSEAEPPLLHQLWRETHLQLLMPRMATGHWQGRLLSLLAHLIQPRKMLEIGTFTGYATLCLAEGMAPDGHLHTLEINPERASRIRRYVAAAGLAGRLTLHLGDAADSLVRLVGETWDLVFIDADKINNARYFELVINQVRPGGLVIVDNVLWGGKALPAYPLKANDHDTRAVRAFNEQVQRDSRVVPLLLPVRDGLLLLRRVSGS